MQPLANAKRVLDAARTLHIEICADAAVIVGPFVAPPRDRDRGAEILARAIDEGAILPNLIADIANAVGQAVTQIIDAKKVRDRLTVGVDGFLTDNIPAEQERKKAATAIPRLVSIALQQAVGLGADVAIRAHLDDELLRRMPRDSQLEDARSRKLQLEKRRLKADELERVSDASNAANIDLIGEPVRELIARHFNYRLRDPRVPLAGERLKLNSVPPPFLEAPDRAEVVTKTVSDEPPSVTQPSYVRVDGMRVQTLREVMVSTMARKR